MGWDMNKAYNFILNQFKDVMTIDFNVFGALMMNWIGYNANRASIITK